MSYFFVSHLDTFSTNPQYRVTLTDPDEDEDDLCTILIGLLQKDRRKKRKEGLDMLTIGYVIYKVLLNDFIYKNVCPVSAERHQVLLK